MKHAKPTTKVCSVLLAFVGWVTEASVEDVNCFPACTGRCSGSVFAVVAGRAATAEKNTGAKKSTPDFRLPCTVIQGR